MTVSNLNGWRDDQPVPDYVLVGRFPQDSLEWDRHPLRNQFRLAFNLGYRESFYWLEPVSPPEPAPNVWMGIRTQEKDCLVTACFCGSTVLTQILDDDEPVESSFMSSSAEGGTKRLLRRAMNWSSRTVAKDLLGYRPTKRSPDCWTLACRKYTYPSAKKSFRVPGPIRIRIRQRLPVPSLLDPSCCGISLSYSLEAHCDITEMW